MRRIRTRYFPREADGKIAVRVDRQSRSGRLVECQPAGEDESHPRAGTERASGAATTHTIVRVYQLVIFQGRVVIAVDSACGGHGGQSAFGAFTTASRRLRMLPDGFRDYRGCWPCVCENIEGRIDGSWAFDAGVAPELADDDEGCEMVILRAQSSCCSNWPVPRASSRVRQRDAKMRSSL